MLGSFAYITNGVYGIGAHWEHGAGASPSPIPRVLVLQKEAKASSTSLLNLLQHQNRVIPRGRASAQYHDNRSSNAHCLTHPTMVLRIMSQCQAHTRAVPSTGSPSPSPGSLSPRIPSINSFSPSAISDDPLFEKTLFRWMGIRSSYRSSPLPDMEHAIGAKRLEFCCLGNGFNFPEVKFGTTVEVSSTLPPQSQQPMKKSRENSSTQILTKGNALTLLRRVTQVIIGTLDTDLSHPTLISSNLIPRQPDYCSMSNNTYGISNYVKFDWLRSVSATADIGDDAEGVSMGSEGSEDSVEINMDNTGNSIANKDTVMYDDLDAGRPRMLMLCLLDLIQYVLQTLRSSLTATTRGERFTSQRTHCRGSLPSLRTRHQEPIDYVIIFAKLSAGNSPAESLATVPHHSLSHLSLHHPHFPG
ncbi:hypothetical protein EV361DRAFT_865819 [Lentinula raphanica]|nr:hypothetical protein EV361DRAFT_865819 [Lentinula raphanica]